MSHDRVLLDGSYRGCGWCDQPATGWAATVREYWPACERHGLPGTYQAGPIPRPPPRPPEYVVEDEPICPEHIDVDLVDDDYDGPIPHAFGCELPTGHDGAHAAKVTWLTSED